MAEDRKECTRCGEWKLICEFPKDKKGRNGYASICKACVLTRRQKGYEYQKEYWDKPGNKARKKENARKSYLRNREKILERNRTRNISRRYGLPVGAFEEMLARQGGRCRICGMKPKKRRLHIDHDHDSGAVRGLLCQRCNHMLGNAKDNPAILRMGALYLEESSFE